MAWRQMDPQMHVNEMEILAAMKSQAISLVNQPQATNCQSTIQEIEHKVPIALQKITSNT